MSMGSSLRLAILDNTLSKKHLKQGYARGETDNRFQGLANAVVNGVSLKITIIDPFPFPLNPFRNMHSLFAGIDILRAIKVLTSLNKYDAILAIGESSALALLFFKQIFRFKTPILVLDPAIGFDWKARKKVLDFVLPRAQAVLLRGQNQADLLKRVYGERCQPAVIYHAINTEYYSPQDVTVKDYIFSIGNDIGRDFKTLIEASRDIDAEVVIKTNERSISGLALPENVRIMKERVSFDELKALYAQARFVVVPLKDLPHAGGVNSVLEAMSMGKASIISRSQGIKDYIVDNETALVVEPGNVDQLTTAMRQLLANPEEVARIGSRARRFVMDRFSNETYNNLLATIIQDTYLNSKNTH